MIVNDYFGKPQFGNYAHNEMAVVCDNELNNERDVEFLYNIWTLDKPDWIELKINNYNETSVQSIYLKLVRSDKTGHYYKVDKTVLLSTEFWYQSINIRIVDSPQSVLIGNRRRVLVTIIGNHNPLSAYYHKLEFKMHYINRPTDPEAIIWISIDEPE